ncbi:MAG TPA: clan AA aspartic protease [Methanosarcinales archaeon]|nr:clan AA aspartic protease [Methanosarcinales archaeon]
MGEVRVRVKLTNAVDEALVRRGQLAPEQVQVYETEGLVDTGAVRCTLPPFVVDRLELARVARYMAQYADGRLEEVDLTEGFVLEIMGRRTTEEALVLGDEVLIGQTALEKLDLFVDCINQRLVPNPAHPDQPVSKVK